MFVVHAGLLAKAPGREPAGSACDAETIRRIEELVMRAIEDVERALGNDPRDVSKENRGYDVESEDGETGRLRMIEVKGCTQGADSVTVTRNDIITALNRPDDYTLALVEIEDDSAREPRYVRHPFKNEPDFHVYSVNSDLKELMSRQPPEPINC